LSDEEHLAAQGPITTGDLDVLELDEALQKLAEVDERLATTIELHYFAGLACADIGVMHHVSEATVQRNLRLAKAWILRELHSPIKKSVKESE
jgi:DNA-directed RNA polymerase specialized sigma24 family protein